MTAQQYIAQARARAHDLRREYCPCAVEIGLKDIEESLKHASEEVENERLKSEHHGAATGS